MVKFKCPKCKKKFKSKEEAVIHSKENKHWGDYNG